MAQRTNNGGRSSTRKPVTLDLEAEKIVEEPAKAEAEPVALSEEVSEADATEMTSETEEAITDDAPADEGPVEDTAPPQPASNRGLSALSGGLIGGLVALLGAAGLQWGGLLPSIAPAPEVEQIDLSPVENEIATLRAELESVRDAANSTELSASVDEARAAADAAQSQIAETRSAVEALQQAIADGDAGAAPAVDALSARLNDMQTNLDGIAAQIADGVVGSEGFGQITQSVQSLSETVSTLQTNQSTLQERIDNAEQAIEQGAGGQTVAMAVAATGLKSAVDRGIPFMAELEAFASVGGDEATIASLRDYAAQGVPTVAQLSDEFGAVANAIVAAGQNLDEDASIGDRLMSSARSLVQVRPVGEVEGETPGAIAARMEARLKEGDLAGFLAQRDALPEAGLAASEAFSEAVLARQNVDTLTSTILNNAMAATTPSASQ